VTEALARTACQLRADADLLDSLAKAETERIAAGGSELPLDAVAALPPAIRSRVLRNAAIAAGCPPGALSAGHVAGLEALVTGWRGQRGTDLPGGIRGQRRYGKLLFSAGHRGDDPPSTPRQASNREGAGGRD
jgi:tRNA(Ile)-lysidine synthase